MKLAPSWAPGLCASCQQKKDTQPAPRLHNTALAYLGTVFIGVAISLRETYLWWNDKELNAIGLLTNVLFALAFVVSTVLVLLRKRFAIAWSVVALVSFSLDDVYWYVVNDGTPMSLVPVGVKVFWVVWFTTSMEARATFVR